MDRPTVTISMDAKCAECGKGGAAPSGICLACTNKAIGGGLLKSVEARNVRARFRANTPQRKQEKPMATTGDNSIPGLQQFAKRIAAIMEEIKGLKDDVKEELKAAQKQDIDVKALLRVVKEMGMDQEQRDKQLAFEFVLDDYRKAMGLVTAAREAA